ncbi:MAG: acyltransferase [Ilumatobacteraceae bacterium]|nr:acyltransferase [Ilumatobacteraceae bacterium]
MQAHRCGRAPPSVLTDQTYDAAIEAARSEAIFTAGDPAAPVVRFPTFEGIRALCAFGVLAYHAGTFTGVTWGRDASVGGLGPWIQHLNVGVSIFFVLSGFLLFRPFVLAHLGATARPRIRSYLWRRLVRIYPAYWVALFLSTLILDLDLGDWWGHVRFYSLTQIYWGDTVLGGLVQAWTLATEVSFYLFLPVWVLVVCRSGGTVAQRVRQHYAGLAVLYATGLVVRGMLRAGDHSIGYGTLAANCDLFAIGMALAVASAAAQVRGRAPGGLARTVGEQPALAWLAAACCYAGVVSLRYPYGFDPPSVSQEVVREVLFGFVAALVVAPGVFGRQDRGALRRVLRWRPLVGAGIVSYGIYLWHLTVMIELDEPGSWLSSPSFVTLTLATAVIATAIAAVSWFVVERPLLQRVRRRRRPPGPVDEPQPQTPVEQG